MVLPRGRRAAVVAALRAAHPYEEPAFDVFELADLPSARGLGRIGSLPVPEPLHAFTDRVAAALPATAWGVRAAGDPDRPVQRAAVCGGAGDSALGAAPRRAWTPTSRRTCVTTPRRSTFSGRPGPRRRRPLGLGVAVVRAGGRRPAEGVGR